MGLRMYAYGPDVTSWGGGLKGTGVPLARKKWSADQKARKSPMKIKGTDRTILTEGGRRPEKPKKRSNGNERMRKSKAKRK